MYAIQATINPGETGSQVANLYAALQFLIDKEVFNSIATPELAALKDQLRSEQPSGFYKGAAVTLVQQFQIQAGLGDGLGGVVDDITADRLNQQLKELGAFDDGYRVYGMVRDRTTQAPKPGVQVRAFDQDVANANLLGEAFSDADGAYLIRFDAQAYRRTAAERGGPELFVQALDDAGRIMGQSRQINNAGTATQLDVEMGNWIVRGVVSNRQGLGMLGLRVRAFDRDLRFETALGDEAVTDRAGRYMIVYTPAQFAEADALPVAPDLIVRVYRGGSGDTDLTSALAESPIRFNAQPLETVDLMVPVQGLSEFEQVSQTIEPLLTRQGRHAAAMPRTHLAPLETDSERRPLLPEELTDDDVAFIVGDTGLATENVQAWIQGARLRREALDRLEAAGEFGQPFIQPMTVHSWPFFYALLISRGTINLAGMVRLPRRIWATIQSEAEALSRIQPLSAKDRDMLFDALELINKLLRIDPKFTLDGLLSKAFRLAPLPNDLALQALAHFDEKGDIDPDDFLSLAEHQSGDELALQCFGRALRLHDLTGGDEALMAGLYPKIDGQGSSLEPLANWTGKVWIDAVTEAWSSDQGKPEPNKVWERATDLQWQIERKHPATALLARVEDDPNTFESIGLNPLQGLSDNHRKLLDRVLSRPGGASQATTEFSVEVVNILENLRRFGSTGLPFAVAANLMMKGLNTPMQVLNTPPSVLRDMLDKIYPQSKVDDYVYSLNGHIQSGVAIITNNWVNKIAGGILRFDGNSTPEPEVLENAPTLRGIFGDLDECLCRPCESVLGLPAYLVDLLELLKKIAYVPPGAQPSSALKLLGERRPEIFELDLNCENAEQEVLHIDLAIEVMEAAISNLASTNAQSALASLAYPWNLPFNRDGLALGAYLTKLGSSRYEVLALQGASISSKDLASAILGIHGTTEWQLITTPTGANTTPRTVWENYGLQISNGTTSIIDPSSGKQRTGSPGDVLQWLSVLLDRTGLSLPQLKNLIQCRFVWPPLGTGLYVQFVDANHPCKLSEMYLSGKEDFLFDRLHRLVRLWRKLPNWSLPILDSAVVAFNAGPLSSTNPPNLGQDQLRGIAAVRRAEQALNMRPESILALLLPLKEVRVQADETTSRTLFEDVFQSMRVSEAGQAAFSTAPATPPQPTASGAQSLTRWAVDIAAAIGISAQQVTQYSTVGGAGTVLSVESLTWLYRHACLSRALDLSIQDTLRLVKLMGIDVSAATPTVNERIIRVEQLLNLAESAKRLAGQPIPLSLLIWLLNPVPDAADIADMPELNQKNEASIRSELTELRDALNAIEEPVVTPSHEQELRDSIQALLSEAFGFRFEPDDFVVLFKLISNLASNGGLDADQLRIKTQLGSNLLRSPDDNLKPLFSTVELDDLFINGNPGSEVERLQALLERLWERGPWALAMQRQLEILIGKESASVVVRGIGTEDRADRKRAIQTLTAGNTSLLFGLDQPIASDQEAESWTQKVTWPNNRILQFRAMLQTLAQHQREAKLLETVAAWLNGTTDAAMPNHWNEREAFSLLSANLTIPPASTPSAARHAKDILLSTAFLGANTVPAELVDWARRLNGLAVLVNQLGKSWEEGVALFRNLNLDWREYLLPSTTEARRKLPTLLWLAQPETLGPAALGAVFDVAATTESAKNALASRLGIRTTELSPLFNQANGLAVGTLTDLGQWRDPMLLSRLQHLAALARQLKAGPQEIQVLSGTNETDAAATARSLLISKLGASWTETEQQIDNQLRKQHRDALVGGLLTLHQKKTEHVHWQTADDLYQHYFIDPQVQPCLRTTRILQATAAVQLLMQRILFGIEPAIKLSGGDADDIRRRWDWMRSYRVWEANRKVYLFPENWLFPELRDDKSSSFKQLEAALGHGELNGESAEKAFGSFLIDIARIGHMQVISLYEDVPHAGYQAAALDRRDLFLLGRTSTRPYQYFWRCCRWFDQPIMEWTPWSSIEAEIGGDHALIFLSDGQPAVAWPTLNRHQNNETGDKKKSWWDIDIVWARYDGQHWIMQERSARVVEDTQIFKSVPNRVVDNGFVDPISSFTFRCRTSLSGGPVFIECYAAAIEGAASNVDTSGFSKSEIPISVPANAADSGGKQEILNLLLEAKRKHAPLKTDETGQSLEQDLIDAFLLNLAAEHQLTPYGIDLNSPYYDWLDVFGDAQSVALHRQHKASALWSSLVNDKLNEIKTSNSLPPPGLGFNSLYEYLLSRFVDAGSSSSSNQNYRKFVDSLYLQCSTLEINVRVFAKLKLGNSDGTQPLTTGMAKLTIDGTEYSINLDKPTPVLTKIQFGGKPQRQIKLYWNQMPSQELTVPEIPAGKKLVITDAKFVVDLSTDPGFSSMLVSESQKKWSKQCEFTLSPGAPIGVMKSGGSLLITVADAYPWMNGFLEHEAVQNFEQTNQTLNAERLSFYSTKTTRSDIFNASRTEERFFVVGAARPSVDSQTHQLWSYAEGNAGAIINLSSNQAGLYVYPNVLGNGSRFTSQWAQQRTLPEGNDQGASFGIALLPNSSLIPQHQRTGRFAFDQRMPYAMYNWEIFFHTPLLIADQLTKHQKFEEAERWLRYIFDPSTGESGTSADRFLKFQVFKDLDPKNNVIRELTILARAATGSTSSNEIKIIRHMIDRWREQPFRPFAIARRRHIAFLWRTLFAYLDNLITWADSRYRHDTLEAVQEAALLYVLAARILGRRPAIYKGLSAKPAKTYDDIQDLVDEFGNFWIDAGAVRQQKYVRADTSKFGSSHDPSASLGMLLFCVPHNDKLDQYWNTVEQRLFNIRHCRNIEGIERILPFTEPPIDPELLVRATAAGLSIADALSFRYAPPPHHRFAVLASRAAELAGETRSLGNAMLAAIEKRDAEKLSLLRADHELNLLQSIKELRQLQIEESERNIDALLASRHSVEARYRQYQRLLGKQEIRVPIEGEFGLEESMLGRAESAIADQSSSWGLLVEESKQLEELRIARFLTDADSVARLVAWGFNVSASIASIASISEPQIPGATGVGEKVAKAMSSMGTAASSTADGFRAIAQFHQNEAAQQATNAGHIRRRDEWAFQSNQTLKELQQIDKQLIANRIRIEIARKELANQALQIEQSHAIHDYLRSKYTNTELYQWMVSELGSLHDQAYRMALELARQAERAAGRELGLPEGKPNVIGNAYWDGRRSGLLAGERLHQSIKRLEVFYLNENRREFELTKHISLRRLAPGALLSLIANGTCEVTLPEWLFDQDAPGHYQRRIKTMSLSIPCVVGPYTNVTINATLLSSEVRLSNALSPAGNYERDAADDLRFDIRYGATESICTSSGRDDSGLFETNLRDDRYLPFEYAGAISTWRLEWPGGSPNFDPLTLSDVIFHLRYTAREGGNSLRDAATRNLKSIWSTDDPSSLYLLVDVKREFASEWTRVSEQGTQGINIEIKIDDSFFLYAVANHERNISKLECWTKSKLSGSVWNQPVEISLPNLSRGKTWSIGIPLPEPANSIGETWILIAYSILNADQNI